MRKQSVKFLLLAIIAMVLFASCERVAPNYAGGVYGELWERWEKRFFY